MAQLVQLAIDEGDVRSDVDAPTTARLIFGTINSLTEWYRPGSTTLTPQAAADLICSMVFEGIQTD